MSKQSYWKPDTVLPLFIDMVNGMVDEAKTNHKNLKKAAYQPHLADTELISSIVSEHQKQIDNHHILENQLQRWKNLKINTSHFYEIRAVEQKLKRLKSLNELIVSFAAEIKDKNIHTYMAMHDEQMALDCLLEEFVGA